MTSFEHRTVMGLLFECRREWRLKTQSQLWDTRMKRNQLWDARPEGTAAVLSELTQSHDFKVIAPKHNWELSEQDMKNALPCLMFLERKRCGKIKARGCADGRTQRDCVAREDAASPTASTCATLLTALIDAIEDQCTVTTDIPGAFLQTEVPDDKDPALNKLIRSHIQNASHKPGKGRRCCMRKRTGPSVEHQRPRSCSGRSCEVN